jgi:phosphoribosylamine-glycine ligase
LHPETEIPPHGAHTQPSLVAELNDKGNLADFVPDALLPARRTLRMAGLPEASALLRDGRPIVLKVATLKPSGGGHGVWICRSPADVDAVRGLLDGDERVVVEEFLDIATTVCVHCVVYPDGRSALIGAAKRSFETDAGSATGTMAAGDATPAEVLAGSAEHRGERRRERLPRHRRHRRGEGWSTEAGASST